MKVTVRGNIVLLEFGGTKVALDKAQATELAAALNAVLADKPHRL